MKKIPLIKPYITQEVKDKVCEVLDSGYLTEGPVTREFESLFIQYIKCRYALAVTSCTTGLEMALRALNIGPGDEVIVPDYTYPATIAVVAIVGASIVMVDVDPDTMLINYNALEKAITDKTKAIIPVSIFGNPLDYDKLNQLKEKHGFYIIEDAACSIGAEFKNTKVGCQADISVFSLHPRKFITTGEGGVITTDDQTLADWMLSYKHFGMGVNDSRLTTQFDRIGTNYKLSNIQAALGVVQMQQIDYLLNRRRELAQNYTRLLKDNKNIKIPATTPRGRHSYQSFCIFIENRDTVIENMREYNIETQIGTYALHKHKAYFPGPLCRHAGEFSGSLYAFDHCLTLPMYHDMTMDEQEFVITKLLEIL
ncbi:MAG: aminotransferase DegT [Thermoprotei archaeon]|nr:MAG: aminotransferase DegT [Thermoprotei archaeon]